MCVQETQFFLHANVIFEYVINARGNTDKVNREKHLFLSQPQENDP